MLKLNLDDGRRRLLSDAQVLTVAQDVLRGSNLYYIRAGELARSVHGTLCATFGPHRLDSRLVISALVRMGVSPRRHHPGGPVMYEVRRIQQAKGAEKVWASQRDDAAA
jgi:hypothetical protein